MEDEKIIELYFKRDEKAVSETALKYGRMIYSIANNILKNASDSEECENDTYKTAWNKIPPARPAVLRAFLGRIARNIAFDRYDYNNAEKRNMQLETGISEIEECLGGRSLEEELEQRETARHISDFLRKSGRSKRIVFILRYWYCDSISDIAAELGFSESKVKSMLFRMRKDLKKYLKLQEVRI